MLKLSIDTSNMEIGELNSWHINQKQYNHVFGNLQ